MFFVTILSFLIAVAVVPSIAASAKKTAHHTDHDLVGRFIDARGSIHSRSKRDIWKIYPGTKWCGASNIAKNDNDFGWWEKADRCCRTHDKCDKSVEPGETKYGVKNTGYIALSHCKCDSTFYQCLKAAGTISANGVGSIYFNLLKMSCIEEVYPYICSGWWWRMKCRKSTTPKMVIKSRKRSY